MKILPAIIAAVLLIQNAVDAAATDLQSHGVTQNQIESLAEIMRQAVQQDQIAGGSFLVVHKGEIVFREAFGYADIESK